LTAKLIANEMYLPACSLFDPQIGVPIGLLLTAGGLREDPCWTLRKRLSVSMR
jgi:hypothetical protein